VTASVCAGGRGFGSTPLLDRITARSIRFCSSRIFPGQGYAMKADSVSGGMCSIFLPIRWEKNST
jgi:hypothetical protein